MAKDVSIVFKASDNLSNSIRQMRKNVDGLSRDVSEYRKVQSQAFDKKTEVKLDITKAKKELKDLEKAVKQNVEGSDKAFKAKQKSLEELQEEYRRLSQVAKDASKAERQLQDDISKTSNKNASRGSTNSLMKNLATAGLGNMIGGAITNNLNQSLTSVFGNTTGSAVSGVLGGVASGAAMGAIAGPIGAAVGAAVGGLTGAINAMTELQEKDDDLFRSEVKSLYDLAKKEQENSLINGMGTASRLEQNMISFGTLLKGEANANKFLVDVQQFSSRTPFQMENLLNTSKTLLSYGYKQDEIIPLMTKVGDTGSALGMNPDDINWVATAIGRMQSSGKTSLEYLNPLIERGIPAIRYLSESLGKTQGQIYEMVSKGLIPGAEAAKTIADAMGKEFSGNMEKQSKTYAGLLSTLEDTKAEIDKAMGVGYNEERKKGMQAEIGLLTGITGDKMKEANKLIGQYQADLENQYQKSIFEAMENAMNSEDYLKAQQEGNGAEMGKVIAEARARAEMDYKNSEGYRLQQETDLRLVQGIQQDGAINSAYNEYGKLMAEQFSKGYAGVINEMATRGTFAPDIISSVANTRGAWWQKDWSPVIDVSFASNPGLGLALKSFNSKNHKPGEYATGLDRVPYNGFPMIAHEGERLLTKVEANKLDKGANGHKPDINITINNNSGNPYEITQEIFNQLRIASENYAGEGR